MSEPQIILVPVQGQVNGQQLKVGIAGSEQIHNITQNQQYLNHQGTKHSHTSNNTGGGEPREFHDSTLVKKVTSDPSILYSFVNWENPSRTLGSFFTIISLIVCARYSSPTQWLLKILCTILGTTSLVEGLGRFATKDGIMSRVRPQSYYRPAKSTYSHLFSEVQEAVDMFLLKFQRILFGEDLQGTIVGFVVTLAAYWLISMVPAFWLAIITTVLTYTIAPILSGPYASKIQPVIKQTARDAADGACITASAATDYTVNKSQELGSQARDNVVLSKDYTADKTQEFGSQVKALAASATNYTADRTSEFGSHFRDTAISSNNSAAAKVRGLKDYTIDTARKTAEYTTGDAQHLGSLVGDTRHSATGNTTGSMGTDPDTHYAYNRQNAPPSAPGFDDNVISRSERT